MIERRKDVFICLTQTHMLDEEVTRDTCSLKHVHMTYRFMIDTVIIPRFSRRLNSTQYKIFRKDLKYTKSLQGNFHGEPTREPNRIK